MHVALIDSDRLVIQLISQYLSEAGHSFSASKAELDGLEDFDLIICDFQALAPNSRSLYSELRAHPQLSSRPCVWLGARFSPQDMQTLRKDTRSSFLIKPFSRSSFDEALRLCIRHTLVGNLLSRQAPSIPLSTTDVILDWRQDLQTIEKHQQRIRSQLLLDPQKLYQTKIKDGPDLDKKALRQQLLALILLKSVTVVERDVSTQQLLQEYARQHNILEMETFADGRKALEALSSKASDLIIMEWYPEGLTGLALYNRLRESGTLRRTPILVITSNNDANKLGTLLEEDLHLAVITKPLQTKKLHETIVQLLSASLSAPEIDKALQQAFQRATSPHLLKDLVQDFSKRMPTMRVHLVHVLQTLVQNQHLGEAERLASLLLEQPEFTVAAATSLAKIYHTLQRPEAAADILRYLTVLAPDRLDRLLLAAEEELCLLRPQRAESYIAQAATIDAEHVRVQAAAYLARAVGQHQSLHTSDRPGPLKNLASLLNTVGVTLAQSGQASEAERYYQAALQFVGDRLDQARLTYNLGLCFLRLGDKGKAESCFAEADRLAEGKLPKAQAQLQELADKKS